MSNLAVVPNWYEPWKKLKVIKTTFGRTKKGPHHAAVYWRTNQVDVTLVNKTGSWSTWLTMTPDEGLELAQTLIEAARLAMADADK